MALTPSSSAVATQNSNQQQQQQQQQQKVVRRKMGGCVTKNGALAGPIAAAAAAPTAARLEQSKMSDQSGATSPSTRPSADEPTPPPGLRQRERRRLSLSQSEPVRELQGNEASRGHFLITPGPETAAAAATKTSAKTKVKSAPAGAAASTKPRPNISTTTKKTSSNTDDNNTPHEEESVALAEATATDDDEDEEVCSQQQQQQQPEPEDAAAVAAESAGASAPRHCRRLSVTGLPSSLLQDNFENKRQEVKSDTGHFDSTTLHALGIGYACKKGLKPESPNQDDFFIIRIDDWGLYGVFDGHGPYGHDVSHYVQRELPKLIYNNRHFVSNPGEALRASFVTVHHMLETAAATHRMFDCSLSGCTATVVLHRKDRLWTAHVGDSRCVLGRLTKDGRGIEALDLTIDHKPNNEAEKRRITSSGGQVRRLDGDIPHRVFLKGKLYPGLAMSRAIGDTVGTQAGVICTPDINEWVINPDRDLFVTLCSDGVWEFLTSNEVVSVIQRNGPGSVQASADTIARESWNRWIQEEGNVVDDITCEIVFF